MYCSSFFVEQSVSCCNLSIYQLCSAQLDTKRVAQISAHINPSAGRAPVTGASSCLETGSLCFTKKTKQNPQQTRGNHTKLLAPKKEEGIHTKKSNHNSGGIIMHRTNTPSSIEPASKTKCWYCGGNVNSSNSGCCHQDTDTKCLNRRVSCMFNSLTGQATNTITWHFQNLQKINKKKKTAKQESRSQTEGVRPSTSTDNHVKGDHSIEASSSSKTIWKETKDSESHICADHVKLSNFVNFYMKSSRSD